jgi:hypothetical protein
VTQLPRRDTEPGSAILGFKAGEVAGMTIVGIFGIKKGGSEGG